MAQFLVEVASVAMVYTLTVPENYPLCLFTVSVVPFMTSFMLGGKVMSARKQYDVQYPHLYAVPGVHEKHEACNHSLGIYRYGRCLYRYTGIPVLVYSCTGNPNFGRSALFGIEALFFRGRV